MTMETENSTADAPNIDKLLENIKAKNEDTKETENNSEIKTEKVKTKKKTKKPVKEEHKIPRGMPKSGRAWKTQKTKFSSIKKSINTRPFEKKMEFRNELRHIKELSNSIKEQRKQENEAKKQRRLDNAERRKQNEQKAEVVQVIKNTAKLKRMRKKQLRMIEKRDLMNMKVV